MTVKYGKPMAGVMPFKELFFNENEKMLKWGAAALALYKQQPKRTGCKLCSTPLPKEFYVKSHGFAFYLCGECGHLNGEFEETDAYNRNFFVLPESKISDMYHVESQIKFDERTDKIYVPKVQFIIDSLAETGVNVAALQYLDVGAGSGYMVAAMRKKRLAASGVEVSAPQVALANTMIPAPQAVRVCDPSDIVQIALTEEADVLTFIGVLEHIPNLQAVLQAITQNKSVKYMFFSVPCLAFSNAIEAVFPQVFGRHMGHGHTHAFSNRSLEWMYKNYGFEPIAEWRFGGDIMDLYRSIMVSLKENTDENFMRMIADFFQENGDALQLIIDKAGLSSEIHVLVKNAGA
ncbi:MAG: class I SAM-dependent methyltransferase [Defluviitaleaceae bacterium]|nr:class I SAM-dependent methyltransferase [Defluviitaleaceae bacterium]MCL2238350.1 class I SAM-dependent methyltransferase [Defluviitaleaceae bacterium]